MKKITVQFYELPSKRMPVRDWLNTLSKEDKKKIGEDIKTAEIGWPIGMPVCRALKGTSLHEIRTNISDNRIARVLVHVKDTIMLLLHGFIKKSQKTPKTDIELATKRLKDHIKSE